MNSNHNNGESDKSLNDGLDNLGRAYGHLDQEEPPEMLDQAILNSAHRAVEKKPRWMKFTWLHGLTTTAVFVLAFSLVLNQHETAPVFESGTDIEEPVSLQNAKLAKKQSFDVRTELSEEIKHKDDTRQDAYQNTSFTTVPESKAMEGQSRSQAMESRLSRYVQSVAQDKAEPVNQDMDKEESALEATSLDEADFMAGTLVLEEAEQQPAAPAVAAPIMGPGEPGTRVRQVADIQAEQDLRKIIKLKQTGDPGWEKELESFMRNYPEYPLPEELKVP